MRQLLRTIQSLISSKSSNDSQFKFRNDVGMWMLLRSSAFAQRLSLAERPRSCFFLLLADDLDHVRGVRSQRAVRRTSIHL